jgi:hypothetical protein
MLLDFFVQGFDPRRKESYGSIPRFFYVQFSIFTKKIKKMNRKFYINGTIISELMRIRRINTSELAKRLGKTRSAVYIAQKSISLKDSIAQRILEELDYTMKEVEEMDSKGLFLEINNPINSAKSLEIDGLKELLKNTEKSLREINEKQSERIVNLEESLKNKDIQIHKLIGMLGGVN